jgi:hypothetical protein
MEDWEHGAHCNSVHLHVNAQESQYKIANPFTLVSHW